MSGENLFLDYSRVGEMPRGWCGRGEGGEIFLPEKDKSFLHRGIETPRPERSNFQLARDLRREDQLSLSRAGRGSRETRLHPTPDVSICPVPEPKIVYRRENTRLFSVKKKTFICVRRKTSSVSDKKSVS